MFAEQLVKPAGGGDFWPRFVEEGIDDVATLNTMSEEDMGAGSAARVPPAAAGHITDWRLVVIAVRRLLFSQGKSATVNRASRLLVDDIRD